jgi:hypothetical protein
MIMDYQQIATEVIGRIRDRLDNLNAFMLDITPQSDRESADLEGWSKAYGFISANIFDELEEIRFSKPSLDCQSEAHQFCKATKDCPCKCHSHGV